MRLLSRMRFHVSLQILCAGEAPHAQVTNIRFHTRMGLHVSPEMTWRGKFLVAHVTAKSFDARVGLQMVLEVPIVLELLLTDIAFEGFRVVRMLLHMRREHARAAQETKADRTRESVLFRHVVGLGVLAETWFRGECTWTLVTFVWSITWKKAERRRLNLRFAFLNSVFFFDGVLQLHS